MRPFLTEDYWKSVREFEATLKENFRLTTICQNEDKLNAACGLVTRKALHDTLTRKTMKLIDVEDWSAHKLIIHPTRSEENIDSFAKVRMLFRIRAFLECERKFFNNKIEETFTESYTEVTMNLIDREKAMLTLDKRTCWSTSVFNET